ncbi:MAG: MBL fold metallo-hydrolase [Deltaproteobacteria bacterium]|nr:MAG: MBL fold metallo-hydrolase [Deltaproteobacteria bacterium]
MRVTLLGSGTSSGVPVIGCTCPVCTSDNPRNRRLRCSALVEFNQRALLIDTATDLRQQALRFGIARIDAVLYTHAHADHIHGIDELRVFNLRHLHEIPCYGNRDTISRITSYFDYIFASEPGESFRPFLQPHQVEGPFELFATTIVPIPLWHGSLPVLGWRIGDFAYLTDTNRLPDESLPLLADLQVLVLDALRPRPHPTHLSIDQAVELAQRLQARRTVLTHLSHLIDHDQVQKDLPPGVELAYDGQVFELDERGSISGQKGGPR